MKFDWKRILLIIGFIILVIILGYLLWLLFFRPTAPVSINNEKPTTNQVETGLPQTPEAQPSSTTQNNQKTTLPTTPTEATTAEQAKGGPTTTSLLLDDRTIASSLNGNGSDLNTYDYYQGKFYRVSPAGEISELSSEVFKNATNVTWSKSAEKAVIEFPDDSKIVYDFNTKKQYSLPKHWQDFSFSSDSNQIAFKSYGADSSNNWLAIANADGSGAQVIESMGSNGVYVDANWSPSGQIVAFYREAIDSNSQNIYMIGKNGENFKALKVSGNDFRGNWSPDGKKLLYSVYSTSSQNKPNLWLVDALGDSIGNNRVNLNINTWADKCTYAGTTTLYCAVPRNLPANSGLLTALVKEVPDDLYKVDLTNGQKTKIAEPAGGNYNMSNLTVTNNQQQLYFTDSNSGKIYKIQLR